MAFLVGKRAAGLQYHEGPFIRDFSNHKMTEGILHPRNGMLSCRLISSTGRQPSGKVVKQHFPGSVPVPVPWMLIK